MAIEIDLVLVPVDGSDAAGETAEYAVAIAQRYGADLHLLHVLDEQVMRGLDTGDVTAELVADHHRAFAADVREELPADVRLSTSSAAGFSPGRLLQTPGSVILDSAEELEADFLVVPRQGPSGDPDVTLGKAALYVLEYASQPVLSV